MTSDAKPPALGGYGKQCAHVMLWPQLDHHSAPKTISSMLEIQLIVLQTAADIRRLWAWHICTAFAICACCPALT